MKRLRETHESDALRERARQLLAQVAPQPASDARMRRVRAAIAERQGGARGCRWPRALVLAVSALCMVSTLAAAQSFGVLSYVLERVAIFAAPARPTAEPKKVARKAPPAHDVQASAPSPAREPEAAPAPERKAPVQLRPADNELVRRAVKALRRDGDAALAARMLEEVHVRSPHGALAEEVMSLRVEAALLRKDGRARGYAREYLARYPAGRYRVQVERALAP